MASQSSLEMKSKRLALNKEEANSPRKEKEKAWELKMLNREALICLKNSNNSSKDMG